MADRSYKFDVAVSFAGEERHLVEPIVKKLQAAGVKVFYDAHHGVELWGEDARAFFTRVFLKEARYCVMFVSYHYAAKIWPTAERKAAMARAMEQEGAYILPVRIDDTELEGLLPTVDFKSYKRYGTDGIADLILQKLGRGQGTAGQGAGPTAPAKSFQFPATKIKRSFDDLEKDQFLREGFATVREYFEAGLQHLENSSPDVTTKFEAVSGTKFLCSVYVQKKLKHECKIWLGGSYDGASQDKICYYEGTRINRDQDGSTNDMISLTNDGFTLGFGKGMASAFGTAAPSKNLRTGEEVATDLWQRFTARLGS